MSRSQSIIVALSCGLVLTTALAGRAAACEQDPNRQPIRVSVGANGQPEVKPDSVSACESETIKWVFQGPTAKEFAIRFTSAEDSPFDWGEQKGMTVTGTIKAGAAKDRKRTTYEYQVSVEGSSGDPKIIVEP
jgi:hypothetical protein